MEIAAGRRTATEIQSPLHLELRWRSRLEELRRFMELHGHAHVPRRWTENPRLSHWVDNQRRLLRLGMLPDWRLRRLEELGVRWSTAEDLFKRRDVHWNRLCDALHAFLRSQGHCDVPEGWRDDPELARWAACQRRMLRAGTLREDRVRRFEERGIDWTRGPRRSRVRDRAWDRRFWQLKEYKKVHGHCDLPRNTPGYPGLGRWLSRQRYLIRQDALWPDRRSLLEDLGVNGAVPRATQPEAAPPSPDLRARAWSAQYEALVRFHVAEGHSNVPRRLPNNPTLARWASHQRELRRRGRLSEERVALLDRLHFPWSGRDGLERGRDRGWDLCFARLTAYHRAHGDCNVPACWPDDPSLGRWVAAQRVRRRAGRLKTERVALLDSLGFDWRS